MKTNLPAQQALDKMAENARELGLDYTPAQTDWEAVAADQAMTIALLRAEQPSQHQEPVGTVQCINGVTIGYLDVMQPVGTKLYTAPQPPQPSKPLTPDQMFEAIRPLYYNDKAARIAVSHSKDEYRAIEAAHGIKE